MTGLETFMEEVSGTALAATDTLANFLYKNALVSFVHLDCAAQRDHFLSEVLDLYRIHPKPRRLFNRPLG